MYTILLKIYRKTSQIISSKEFYNSCFSFNKQYTCIVIIYLLIINKRGRTGFDRDVDTKVAGQGAAGLVKSGKNVIANESYDYALAA